MLHSISLAILFGLSAGFTPGPLFTLVIADTLQFGVAAGIRIAVAPFLTDFPIFIVSFLLLMKVANFDPILAVISFCGAFFVARLGYQNLKMKGISLNFGDVKPNSLGKGMLANLLSPYPYLFWVGIGVPVMSKIMVESKIQVVVFLIFFYIVMVGVKMLLVLIVSKSKRFLQGPLYLGVMRFLGCVLIIFAVILLKDGVNLLRHIH